MKTVIDKKKVNSMGNSGRKFQSSLHGMCVTDSHVKFEEKLNKMGSISESENKWHFMFVTNFWFLFKKSFKLGFGLMKIPVKMVPKKNEMGNWVVMF